MLKRYIIETYATLSADKVSAYAMVKSYLEGKIVQYQDLKREMKRLLAGGDK